MKHSRSIRYTDIYLGIKTSDNRFAQYVLLLRSSNPIITIYRTV